MGVMTTEVRPMRRDEHHLAAGVACRALADSPTTAAIYGPDPLDGLVGLHRELALFFDLLPSPQWAAVAGGCIVATAGVAPPGGCIGAFMDDSPPGAPPAAEPEVGDPARAHLFWKQWAAADPGEEHWHVGPVGVEPGYQGRGLGGAVMRTLCADLDQHGRLAWLETDKERNVRFYIGLGFEVAGNDTVLGVRTWYMRRDPR
jgi:ribosomal protein S18 acetylase RimI-like enzyme